MNDHLCVYSDLITIHCFKEKVVTFAMAKPSTSEILQYLSENQIISVNSKVCHRKEHCSREIWIVAPTSGEIIKKLRKADRLIRLKYHRSEMSSTDFTSDF